MPDLLLLVHDRQVDRPIQQGRCHLRLKVPEHAFFTTLPVRQLLPIVVEYLGVRHFFGFGDQFQRLMGRRAVVEHHRGFDGVVDRTGNQVQVVVGVHAQGQHTEQGQRDTGQAHCHQGNAEVAAAEYRTQGGTHAGLPG